MPDTQGKLDSINETVIRMDERTTAMHLQIGEIRVQQKQDGELLNTLAANVKGQEIELRQAEKSRGRLWKLTIGIVLAIIGGLAKWLIGK